MGDFDLAKRAQEVGFRRAALEAGATITDGPVAEDFAATWGKPPLMSGSVAHYWTAERPEWRDSSILYGLRSACGLTTVGTKSVPLLGAGNLPFCARCENTLMRKARNT